MLVILRYTVLPSPAITVGTQVVPLVTHNFVLALPTPAFTSLDSPAGITTC